MKKTFLISILIVCLPFLASTQSMPEIAGDGIDLYGTMYSNGGWDVGTYKSDSAGIYMFPAGSPQHVCYKVPLVVAGGCTYHGGKVYCNVLDDEGNIENVVPEWRIYDLESKELQKSIPLQDGWRNITNSLTYDDTTDKIYALARTNFNDFYLARIDPETAEWENVGELDGHWFASIACNKDGMLYAVATDTSGGDYYLVRINKEDGRVAKVGNITCNSLLEGDLLVVMSSKSALFFNKLTGKLYWMLSSSSLYLNDTYTPLLEINVNTGAATMVGYFEKEFAMSGAFLTEPLLSAPAKVESFDYEPLEEGSIPGYLSVKAPATAYDGTPLTGKLTVEVVQDGRPLVTFQDVDPGETVKSDVLDFDYGRNSFLCRAYNAEGEKGVTCRFDEFMGYDLPGYPKNVKLVADGLKLTLSWDTPTDGINGLPIDKEGISYRIVRYPNEITVEEDFMGNAYTEDIPEDMTRYIYMVVARYNNEDGYATMSNPLIAGTPLDVPYKTDFEGPEEFYNYYHIIDNNSDRCSWGYDAQSQSARYSYSETNSADDWIFTPPVNYKAGRTYNLTFHAKSGYELQLERLEVTFGDESTVEAQKQILDIPEVAFEGKSYTTAVTPEKDGVHFFGFHVHSLPFGGYLWISSVEITDSDAGIEGNAVEENISVTSSDGRIRIGNGRNSSVSVYTSGGMLIHSSCSSCIELDVAPGLYVVKSDNLVRKVAVL